VVGNSGFCSNRFLLPVLCPNARQQQEIDGEGRGGNFSQTATTPHTCIKKINIANFAVRKISPSTHLPFPT
jgi:hypothetical protein